MRSTRSVARHEPHVLARGLLQAAVARRAPPGALGQMRHAHARIALRDRVEHLGCVVIGGVIDRDHLEIRHVLAEDRGQAGLEKGLLAMRRQDEAQPGGHWLASYSMTVSARVFVDVPVLCGHRGSGRGRGGENTLGSFRAAVAAGLPWVEVDARITADGVLVAYHEAVVDDGRYVSQLRSQETDELGLMRVADLLEDLPPHIGVDIDLKSSLEDAQRPRDETTGALVARSRRPAGERAHRCSSRASIPSALLIAREHAPVRPARPAHLAALPAAQGDPGGRSPRPPGHRAARRVLRPAPGASPPGRARDRRRRRGRPRTPGCRSSPGARIPSERDVLVEAGVDCLCIDDVL